MSRSELHKSSGKYISKVSRQPSLKPDTCIFVNGQKQKYKPKYNVSNARELMDYIIKQNLKRAKYVEKVRSRRSSLASLSN
jgi:hypothetical protein